MWVVPERKYLSLTACFWHPLNMVELTPLVRHCTSWRTQSERVSTDPCLLMTSARRGLPADTAARIAASRLRSRRRSQHRCKFSLFWKRGEHFSWQHRFLPYLLSVFVTSLFREILYALLIYLRPVQGLTAGLPSLKASTWVHNWVSVRF